MYIIINLIKIKDFTVNDIIFFLLSAIMVSFFSFDGKLSFTEGILLFIGFIISPYIGNYIYTGEFYDKYIINLDFLFRVVFYIFILLTILTREYFKYNILILYL